MKYHIIFEQADNGRIWAYLPDFDNVAGNGSSIDEARASLLKSMRLAREYGDPLVPKSNVIAVEVAEVA
jgi:hypothetical protein